MRNAYALLGVLFLIVFGGAYLLLSQNHDRTVASPESQQVPATKKVSEPLSLTSPAFTDGESIQALYTCDGQNTPPPLVIQGVPEGAQSLVLVMDDPDIPREIKEARGIDSFDHWVVYNIPANTSSIDAKTVSGVPGINSLGETGYVGPCPPTDYQPLEHRYIFRLYAISGELQFLNTPTLAEVELAAQNMQLQRAELLGVYQRPEED